MNRNLDRYVLCVNMCKTSIYDIRTFQNCLRQLSISHGEVYDYDQTSCSQFVKKKGTFPLISTHVFMKPMPIGFLQFVTASCFPHHVCHTCNNDGNQCSPKYADCSVFPLQNLCLLLPLFYTWGTTIFVNIGSIATGVCLSPLKYQTRGKPLSSQQLIKLCKTIKLSQQTVQKYL